MKRAMAPLAIGTALVLVSLAGAARSQTENPASPGADELVAARQGAMTMSVFTLARLSAAASDDKPLTGAGFPASGLAAFARSLPVLFSAQTQAVDGTRALPAIWEQPEDFAARIAEYQGATAELEAAARADNRENFNAALAKTKAACKACHDSYRVEP